MCYPPLDKRKKGVLIDQHEGHSEKGVLGLLPYLGASIALISGHLSIWLSFGLHIILLDQLSCFGNVAGAMQQAGIQDPILNVRPAAKARKLSASHHTKAHCDGGYKQPVWGLFLTRVAAAAAKPQLTR